MAETVIMIRLIWDRTALPGLCPPGFYATHVIPSDEFPYGRKGLVVASAWEQLQSPAIAGLVILDGDVAIDPQDRRAMLDAVEEEPKVVHVAPVRLWPVSTKAPGWVWGHGKGGLFNQQDHDDPDMFGFGFTYLPRRLMTACIAAGMEEWTYPGVDRRTANQARKMKLPVRVVRGASPKHINF